eukprot:scaffold50956_cov19-Tisochrysis_lutea.AAC.3
MSAVEKDCLCDTYKTKKARRARLGFQLQLLLMETAASKRLLYRNGAREGREEWAPIISAIDLKLQVQRKLGRERKTTQAKKIRPTSAVTRGAVHEAGKKHSSSREGK